VVVDGKQHGETPLELPLPTNAPPVMLAVKLDGYETVSRPVSAGDAPEVSVKLTPKPAAQKPRRPAPSPLDIKTDR
jgi:eukaryotic-like serine/threonine-protein kinase